MKIAATSDTHRIHDQVNFPECDVAILAGDVCGYGTLQEFCRAIAWFGQRKATNKIYVPGNHDRFVEDNLEEARNICKQNGVIMLVGESITIDTFVFYGFPWTPPFGRWAFMSPDDESGISEKLKTMPEHVDVMICHGPPRGHLDLVWDRRAGHINVGSTELLAKIMMAQPSVVICGHIHEGAEQGPKHDGVSSIGASRIYNVSALDKHYIKRKDAIEIDL